jgi:2-amino-4-hydroxy-6-hydroxymethyldihydropteridine diphosphokinase
MSAKKTLEGAFHLATLGIGSNQGNREGVIHKAIQSIVGVEGNRLQACSSLYETEPYGQKEQEWFLNCVVQVETSCDIKFFFALLQQTETELGRVRQERWGPRTIDLDLLFFDNMIFQDAELIVPHPEIARRRFVLEPLCEIAPKLVHPGMHQSIEVLYNQVADSCRVICLKRQPVASQL